MSPRAKSVRTSESALTLREEVEERRVCAGMRVRVRRSDGRDRKGRQVHG